MTPGADIKLIKLNEANFRLIEQLIGEAEREGYAFVQRTIDEWGNDTNRFSRKGEALWGLTADTVLIGMGGINYDPYTEQAKIGRVRHLYIHPAYRRQGYASILMQTIISQARRYFIMLRLFTDNPQAAVFYEKLGFGKADELKASHILFLAKR